MALVINWCSKKKSIFVNKKIKSVLSPTPTSDTAAEIKNTIPAFLSN